jgi:hypothetical protein
VHIITSTNFQLDSNRRNLFKLNATESAPYNYRHFDCSSNNNNNDIAMTIQRKRKAAFSISAKLLGKRATWCANDWKWTFTNVIVWKKISNLIFNCYALSLFQSTFRISFLTFSISIFRSPYHTHTLTLILLTAFRMAITILQFYWKGINKTERWTYIWYACGGFRKVYYFINRHFFPFTLPIFFPSP